MKNLFLLVITMFALAACSKDDDCNDETLATTIVGGWNVYFGSLQQGAVEFQADGTLIDGTDALIGGEAGGMPLDEKSYEINGDVLSLTAANDAGSVSVDMDVTSYTCDQIEIDFGGLHFELRR